MRTTLIVILVCAALALSSVLLWPGDHPREGAWYVSEGRDSVLIEQVIGADSGASPLTRLVVHDLLAGDLQVRVDKTGPCGEVAAHYRGANAHFDTLEDPLERALLHARPIALFDSTARSCFAYRVSYSVPLDPPVTWRGHLLSQLPMQLVMIHPNDDIKQFRYAQSR